MTACRSPSGTQLSVGRVDVIRDSLLRPPTQKAGTAKQLVWAVAFLLPCSKPDNLAAS